MHFDSPGTAFKIAPFGHWTPQERGAFYRGRCVRAAITLAFVLVVPLMVSTANAEVRLHGLFGDHMVLQQNAKVRVWGWASPGETVEVKFRKQVKRVMASRDGRWAVALGPETAGGPHELIVRGRNELRVRDVLVGEVWLCTGQSNMEWTLKDSQDGAAEVVASANPNIRHIKIGHRTAMQPQEDIAPAQWQSSQPETAGEFSAVGYFFAQKLQQELGVPVGLINISWGGSNIETWMSRESLQAHRELRKLLPELPKSTESFITMHRARMNAQVRSWQPDASFTADKSTWKDAQHPDDDWKTLNAPGIWETQGLDGFDGKLWYRRTVELTTAGAAESVRLHLGMIDDCDETFVNGQKVGSLCGWDTPRRYDLLPGLLVVGRNTIAVRVTDTGGGGGFHGESSAMKLAVGANEISLAGPWKARIESPLDKKEPGMNDLPSIAFNAMINPVAGYGIRGALWYQGEANVPRAAQYASTFPLMINDWRQRWGQGDFPFLYVQLAAFLPLEKNKLSGSSWAELRDAQRGAIKLRNTGMAVATDIGDARSIHPRNKRDVGLRLARIAMKKSYGGHAQAGGPMFKSARVVGNRIELKFINVARGLVSNGKPLRGFVIADASRQFRPADAHIINRGTVVVSHAGIKRPRAVRFGWVDNPEENNLYNSAGLPASPFRTDQWPRLTEGRLYTF